MTRHDLPRASNNSKLCQCRIRRGMTQEQLAKRLNTNKQLISLYENGDVVPSVSRYKEIAEILGYDWRELVD